MRIGAVSVLFFLSIYTSAFASRETNSDVLDKIWNVGKKNACSQNARARFNDSTLIELKNKIKDEFDRGSLAQILNPFLFSLGYSHTQFFTENNESYFLFKGYQAEIKPSGPPAPLLVNPGIQVGMDDHGYYVREVLHGTSAKVQGMIKGDRILMVDGIPFSGSWGRQSKTDAVVTISHQGQIKDLHLQLPALNWSQAFQDATLSSIRTVPFKGKKIGYVHLWSGVHPESADALWKAAKEFNSEKVDGVILDLRGGYGGAFWPHLDPFFADRHDYFVFSATDGDDKTSIMKADPQSNPDAFMGPMAVLIDDGSRSGKEALAFQFKKSHRAAVIGTATQGYFSGGGLFFVDEPTDYMLYLCVMRDSKLDDVDVEGIGVSPDIAVPFNTHNEFEDSQLKAALAGCGKSQQIEF